MVEFFDLHNLGKLEDAQNLGWTRIVKPTEVKSTNLQSDVRKIRNDADVIIVSGGSRINRLASECWEVDMIGSPEMHEDKDFMHQQNSGIDYVIARGCAEKGIAIEFNFSNVLNANGRKRAQILSRMAQNVFICRGTKCDMVITSGAKDKFGLRSPRELIAFGVILGMTLDEAKAAVSLNPCEILNRTEDRNNPDIILKGLEVKIWASEKKKKKIFGWY